METVYVSCADTAKLVRKALQEHFPSIKFSVKSKVYSGGASITIRYTDGCTTKEVDDVVFPYKGANFDGMIDLKTDVYTVIDGKRVNYGSDYIFAERSYSPAFLARIAKQVCDQWGFDVPSIKISDYDGSGYLDDTLPAGMTYQQFRQRTGQVSLRDLIMQTAYTTSALPAPAVQAALDADFQADYERGDIDESSLDRLLASAEPVEDTASDVIRLKRQLAELESSSAVQLMAKLRLMKLDNLSPLEALTTLYELRRMALSE